MALTIPLTVLAAFLLARELFPRLRSLSLACALLVGQHPVLVDHGASVSPDALAKALAACGLWLLVRFVSGRSH